MSEKIVALKSQSWVYLVGVFAVLIVVGIVTSTLNMGELSRALLMGAGWAINLAVAEWLIRGRPAHPIRSPVSVSSHPY